MEELRIASCGIAEVSRWAREVWALIDCISIATEVSVVSNQSRKLKAGEHMIGLRKHAVTLWIRFGT